MIPLPNKMMMEFSKEWLLHYAEKDSKLQVLGYGDKQMLEYGDARVAEALANRKPLTDEQIHEHLEQQWDGYESYHDCFKEIVRWVEAAHGIKERS